MPMRKGHSSEPQPSTSGYVPPQEPALAAAPAQTKHQDKNMMSDSGKGNFSYESMMRNVLVGSFITLKCTQLTCLNLLYIYFILIDFF